VPVCHVLLDMYVMILLLHLLQNVPKDLTAPQELSLLGLLDPSISLDALLELMESLFDSQQHHNALLVHQGNIALELLPRFLETVTQDMYVLWGLVFPTLQESLVFQLL